MNLKPLPKTLRKNPYDYELLESGAGYAIYAQKRGGRVVGYETHKVRVSAYPFSKQKPSVWTHYHQLASNEEFGYFGWSYSDLESAIAKAEEIRTGGNEDD